jgi:excisionase family DNA binding protein
MVVCWTALSTVGWRCKSLHSNDLRGKIGNVEAESAVGSQGEPILDAVNRRVAAIRSANPRIRGVSLDVLFLGFLQEMSRFGVFSYGPITIDVGLVEEVYMRALPGSPEVTDARVLDSTKDFYQRVAAELEATGGTRRPNELHYLLAFMRSPDGLPHKVFSELGVSPEAVLEFAHRDAQGVSGRPDVFLTPEDVAGRLNVNVQTVRAWIRSGKLPASRLAGRRVLRIRESDIDEVLEPVDPSDFA